jgi:hypothetical protein
MIALRFAVAALIALLILASRPSTSSASFTQEEAASILHARNATLDLSAALRGSLAPLITTYTTTNTRRIFGTAMQQGVQASIEANTALAVLLNVNTHVLNSDGHRWFAGLSRTERLAHAWWRIDRAIWYVENAQKTLRTARGLNSNAQYQELIRRADQVTFAGALKHFHAIDRALAYSDPNPPSFPQVVGPHGDFESAEWDLFISQRYAQSALTDMASTYLAMALPLPGRSGDAFRRIFDATDTVVGAMVLLAGVTWTAEQAGDTPFFRALDVLQALTDRALLPTMWAQAIADLRSWPDTPSYDVIVHRITEAWVNSDHAAWSLMVFLDCAKLKNPKGCGGR